MGEGSVLPQRDVNSVALVPDLKKILVKGVGEITVQCRGTESKKQIPHFDFKDKAVVVLLVLLHLRLLVLAMD